MLSGWKFQRKYLILNSNVELTDYQIPIYINRTSGIDTHNHVFVEHKCKNDFGDIRFTDKSDNLLPYTIISASETVAKFIVKVPAIDMQEDYIYIYYGNEAATNISNPTETFIYYSTFADLTGWTQTGTTIASSIATLTSTSNETPAELKSNAAYGPNVAICTRIRNSHSYDATTSEVFGLQFSDDRFAHASFNSLLYREEFVNRNGTNVNTCSIDNWTENSWDIIECQFTLDSIGWQIGDNPKDVLNLAHPGIDPMQIVFRSQFLTVESTIDVDWVYVRNYHEVEEQLEFLATDEVSDFGPEPAPLTAPYYETLTQYWPLVNDVCGSNNLISTAHLTVTNPVGSTTWTSGRLDIPNVDHLIYTVNNLTEIIPSESVNGFITYDNAPRYAAIPDDLFTQSDFTLGIWIYIFNDCKDSTLFTLKGDIDFSATIDAYNQIIVTYNNGISFSTNVSITPFRWTLLTFRHSSLTQSIDVYYDENKVKNYYEPLPISSSTGNSYLLSNGTNHAKGIILGEVFYADVPFPSTNIAEVYTELSNTYLLIPTVGFTVYPDSSPSPFYASFINNSYIIPTSLPITYQWNIDSEIYTEQDCSHIFYNETPHSITKSASLTITSGSITKSITKTITVKPNLRNLVLNNGAAYYPMCGSGSEVINGFNGTILYGETAAWRSGRLENEFLYNGALYIPYALPISPSGNFTISTWFHTAIPEYTITSSSETLYYSVLLDLGSTMDLIIDIYTDDTAIPKLGITINSSDTYRLDTPSTPLPLNQWAQLHLVKLNNTLYPYINESPVKNADGSQYSITIPSINSITGQNSFYGYGRPIRRTLYYINAGNGQNYTNQKWIRNKGFKHALGELMIYKQNLLSEDIASIHEYSKLNYLVGDFTATFRSYVIERGTTSITRKFVNTSAFGADSWHWDFGDGNYSTEENPTHTYTTPGNYTVTLYAENTADSIGTSSSNPVEALYSFAESIAWPDGSSGTVTASADPGYHMEKFIIDGQEYWHNGISAVANFVDVCKEHSVEALFAEGEYWTLPTEVKVIINGQELTMQSGKAVTFDKYFNYRDAEEAEKAGYRGALPAYDYLKFSSIAPNVINVYSPATCRVKVNFLFKRFEEYYLASKEHAGDE